jgi:DNA primase
MLNPINQRDIALKYHRLMREEIRRYLNGRGIPDAIIKRQLLGWNGSRITIPIFGRNGEVLFFRFAKSPLDRSESPKMLSTLGSGVELYGWERLVQNPNHVVICEGEFDRLVLEANDIPAVTSTAGAGAFLADWAPYFAGIHRVYVCFDRDEAGAVGARNVKTILPRAKIVTLPAEVGEKGDITDYFVRLGKTRVDFDLLLASAAASEMTATAGKKKTGKRPRQPNKAVARRAERLKKAIPLERIVGQYTSLNGSGPLVVGLCPFHKERNPSFTVYANTDTYFCFGCRAGGDVVQFLMDKESITFGQALEMLERFLQTDELFPGAAGK